MAEQFEEVYTYISTQGDGPALDAALALAKTALQPGAQQILPPMPNAGMILMAIDGGEVQTTEVWPLLINQLTLSFTAAAAILANHRRANL